MGELVVVERRDDGVAVITLNNPKVNALSQALLAAKAGAYIISPFVGRLDDGGS